MKIIFWNNLFTLLALVGYADMNDKCSFAPEAFVESQLIKAVVNKGTLLPCLRNFNINVKNGYVEWSKEGENEDIYKFGEGKSRIPDKYEDRLSIPMEELKKGNTSLTVSKVTLSDKGKYCCCITRFINSESNMTCTFVTLDVVSEDVKPKPPPKEEGRRDQPRPKEVKPPPEDIKSFWKTTGGYFTIGGIVAVLLIGAGVGFFIWWKRRQRLRVQRQQNRQNSEDPHGGPPQDPQTGPTENVSLLVQDDVPSPQRRGEDQHQVEIQMEPLNPQQGREPNPQNRAGRENLEQQPSQHRSPKRRTTELRHRNSEIKRLKVKSQSCQELRSKCEESPQCRVTSVPKSKTY